MKVCGYQGGGRTWLGCLSLGLFGFGMICGVMVIWSEVFFKGKGFVFFVDDFLGEREYCFFSSGFIFFFFFCMLV